MRTSVTSPFSVTSWPCGFLVLSLGTYFFLWLLRMFLYPSSHRWWASRFLCRLQELWPLVSFSRPSWACSSYVCVCVNRSKLMTSRLNSGYRGLLLISHASWVVAYIVTESSCYFWSSDWNSICTYRMACPYVWARHYIGIVESWWT